MKELNIPKGSESVSVQFEKGLIIIGANGAGKTRLGVELESSQKVYRINAHRSLDFPDDIRSSDVGKAEKELYYGISQENWTKEQYENNFSNFKYDSKPATHLVSDYQVLMTYLLSDHLNTTAEYYDQSSKVDFKVELPKTKLVKLKEIWEKILPHRKLDIGSGKISVNISGEDITYNASEMSEGERATFYLVGKVLAAPKESTILIDEPEAHLHRSIQAQLWNSVESIRDDCAFVYLTHDVLFASSRVGFKKIWLQSFDGSEWEWKEIIEESVLPDELLFEVVGSRKKVLFVEGDSGSYDSKLYQKLFSNFLIKPCGSCANVVSYTKALRQNPDLSEVKVYGLVDLDTRSQDDVTQLQEVGVFSLNVAVVEHLFIVPELLKIIADNQSLDADSVEQAKASVFDFLNIEFDSQVALITKDRIDKLKKAFPITGNNPKDIAKSIASLIEQVDVESIHREISQKLREIINAGDYKDLLKYYNRKSVAARISSTFSLRDKELPELVLRKLEDNVQNKMIFESLKPYFPAELVELGRDHESS